MLRFKPTEVERSLIKTLVNNVYDVARVLEANFSCPWDEPTENVQAKCSDVYSSCTECWLDCIWRMIYTDPRFHANDFSEE